MNTPNKKTGFTLIELMIVVAIIGILAAIAVPQFANLIAKSQEGRTKANLATIRSALSIYYGDLEGKYPVDTLISLTVNNRYLKSIPDAALPKTRNNIGHASINTVNLVSGDGGGWYYNNSGIGNNTWGQVLVQCSHQDIKSVSWFIY